jgi:hypothetical protein
MEGPLRPRSGAGGGWFAGAAFGGFLLLALVVGLAAAAFLDFVQLLSHRCLLYFAATFALFTARNMTVPPARFNIILAAFLLAALGCASTEDKKKNKEATFLRFHLETNPDGTQHNFSTLVYRANPMRIQVERNAALDEGFMEKAEIVAADEFGNFAIKITFDETGKQRLNYVTSSYKGRHMVALARWTETRALAAPLIKKTITDGVFVFTPDATREEAERIVFGLNNVIKTLKKPYTF